MGPAWADLVLHLWPGGLITGPVVHSYGFYLCRDVNSMDQKGW